MKRCPKCSSIWVCWNWLELDDVWIHECWNCALTWETTSKVYLGMPYFLVRRLSDYFIEPGRFDREIAKEFNRMLEDEADLR